MKEFVFECYDTLNCYKITEEGLFKFMNVISKRVPGINSTPTSLLTLHEYESDMFLELFANDFCKISAALAAKAKRLKAADLSKSM